MKRQLLHQHSLLRLLRLLPLQYHHLLLEKI
jgi:hypothetical protein